MEVRGDLLDEVPEPVPHRVLCELEPDVPRVVHDLLEEEQAQVHLADHVQGERGVLDQVAERDEDAVQVERDLPESPVARERHDVLEEELEVGQEVPRDELEGGEEPAGQVH